MPTWIAKYGQLNETKQSYKTSLQKCGLGFRQGLWSSGPLSFCSDPLVLIRPRGLVRRNRPWGLPHNLLASTYERKYRWVHSGLQQTNIFTIWNRVIMWGRHPTIFSQHISYAEHNGIHPEVRPEHAALATVISWFLRFNFNESADWWKLTNTDRDESMTDLSPNEEDWTCSVFFSLVELGRAVWKGPSAVAD
jgi:hypothetical protein